MSIVISSSDFQNALHRRTVGVIRQFNRGKLLVDIGSHQGVPVINDVGGWRFEPEDRFKDKVALDEKRLHDSFQSRLDDQDIQRILEFNFYYNRYGRFLGCEVFNNITSLFERINDTLHDEFTADDYAQHIQLIIAGLVKLHESVKRIIKTHSL
ncbi:MAG: hypothetical protein QM703_22880 [Gemmatales bacterium]